jgi:hypothetical protein
VQESRPEFYKEAEQTATSGVPEPGPELEKEEDAPTPLPKSDVVRALEELPKVTVLQEKTPEELSPSRFLTAMIMRVLAATPVNMHRDARKRRASPRF